MRTVMTILMKWYFKHQFHKCHHVGGGKPSPPSIDMRGRSERISGVRVGSVVLVYYSISQN